MSELLSIRIEKIHDRTARARFEVVHPDKWTIPSSKCAALQTLIEAYWVMKNGFLWDEQPKSEDAFRELTSTHPAREQFEHWLELMHGRKVTITEDEYERLNDGDIDPTLSCWGQEGEVYFKRYQPDYRSVVAAAEEVIEDAHLEDEMDHPRAHAGAPDPKATLVFTVADPELLSHLVVDVHWDSAMYDFAEE